VNPLVLPQVNPLALLQVNPLALPQVNPLALLQVNSLVLPQVNPLVLLCPHPLQNPREALLLTAILALVAVVLSASVEPGIFTADEASYLTTVRALRAGRLSVPGTEGLPPSQELLGFDPAPRGRRVTATPVVPVAPPLYAFIALPFALVGFHALCALQVLAFCAGGACVFVLARRLRRSGPAPWLALGLYGLGGYLVEYALGMWPHALSVALLAAALLAADVAREGRPKAALLAGLALGLATGVRYQNLVPTLAVGATLLLGLRRRAVLPAFALGLLGPLALSTVLNGLRLGHWNPVTKGPGYLNAGVVAVAASRDLWSALHDAWLGLATKLLDFSLVPSSGSWAAMGYEYVSETGAYLGGTSVRKAFFQSAPWAAPALLAVLVAARPWRLRALRADAPDADPERRALVALGLPVLAILALFFAGGSGRHEGACANARYLLELVPCLAVATVLVLPISSWRGLLAGGVAGALAGAALCLLPSASFVRQLGLMRVPLALAAGLLLLLGLARRRAVRGAPLALAIGLGLALGWSAAVHLGDDVVATRAIRRGNGEGAEMLAPVLTARASAVLAAHPAPFAPLALEHDLLLVTVGVDQAADAPRLIDAFHRQGRSAFFLGLYTPPAGRARVLGGRMVRQVGPPGADLWELGPRVGSAPAGAGGR
jgi:hypothetical protein